MWLKFVLLVAVSSTIVSGISIPRKPLRSRDLENLDDDGLITSFVDPVDGISYRLPNNTIPLHYEVFLSTDIHRGMFPFQGHVRIKIRAVENTTTITLHQRYLTVGNITLLRESGATWQSNLTFEYDNDREFLEVTPNVPITEDTEFWLTIDFFGTIRNDEAGFYRSSYLDSDGNRRWLAITQFESTDARHGFPCFDEPGIRSTFDIQIRHHLTYNAVSNMPVVSVEQEPLTDYVITTFDTCLISVLLKKVKIQ